MISRRRFVATGTSGLLLSGCDRLTHSESFRGVPITLSVKSILMAWARTALFLVGITMSIWAAVCSDGSQMRR